MTAHDLATGTSRAVIDRPYNSDASRLFFSMSAHSKFLEFRRSEINCESEVQPRAERKLAAGGSTADAPERRRVDVGIRVIEYRMVQHVCNIHPEFQLA